MELLNLKYNESFEIDLGGEKVKVTLFENKENPEEFTFGFDAPKSICINREEVVLRASKIKK
tara:strand:- start:389 stop:574 length:186 start_codon:yes stop_codon:yes gene_type:complete